MSNLTIDTTFRGCLPTVVEAAQYFGKNTPFGRFNEQTGALRMIKSAANTSGFAQISAKLRQSPNGKMVKMEFMSDAPMCLAVCAKDFECDATRIPYSAPINFHEWELSRRIVVCNGNGDEIELKMDYTTYQEYCNVNHINKFAQDKLKYISKLGTLINKQILHDLSLLIDVTAPNQTTVPILVRNSVSNQLGVTNDWLIEIEKKMEEKGYMASDYLMFGGSMITKLQVAGASLPFQMFYDSGFDAKFGSSLFTLIPKGTFQLADYSFYEHYPITDKQDEIHNVMMLPIGDGINLPIDYVYKDIITNCRTYSFAPSYWGEVVKAIPGDCVDANNDGIIVVKDCGIGTLSC